MNPLIYERVETLGFRDVPDPSPRAEEHLISVEAVGIYGSDMQVYLGHDARSIIDYANDNDIDYFLGSPRARVVRHAVCSVHVQRNPI